MWIFDPCLPALKRTYVCHITDWGQFHFCSTEFQFQFLFFFNFNSNSATHNDFQIEFQFPRFNLNVNFEDFNSNLNLNISQLMSSSKLSMAIITWYIELLISLYHVSVLFPFLKDCNFVVLCLIKYHDLLEQHQCWFLSTGLSRNLNWD